MLAPDYDAGDAAPANEQIASTYKSASEDAPWKEIVCVLSPHDMSQIGPRHFVRNGAVPTGQDVRLYDVGNLFVISVDGTGNAPIGKLWVEYDVTFDTPHLPPTGGGGDEPSTDPEALASVYALQTDDMNIVDFVPGSLGNTYFDNMETELKRDAESKATYISYAKEIIPGSLFQVMLSCNGLVSEGAGTPALPALTAHDGFTQLDPGTYRTPAAGTEETEGLVWTANLRFDGGLPPGGKPTLAFADSIEMLVNDPVDGHYDLSVLQIQPLAWAE